MGKGCEWGKRETGFPILRGQQSGFLLASSPWASWVSTEDRTAGSYPGATVFIAVAQLGEGPAVPLPNVEKVW